MCEFSLLDSLDIDEHWIDENVFIDQHHILTQMPHFLRLPCFTNTPITFPPLSFMDLNLSKSESEGNKFNTIYFLTQRNSRRF
jgi:hypothetical protein